MSSDSSTKVVMSAVIGNAFVAAAKFVGWSLTYSPSMMAEAIHSVADTANQTLLYIGIRQSHQGPTRQFPLGRGRARYLWNLISAVGIFFIGFGVTAYHGIHSLMTQTEVASFSWIAVGVLVIAFIVEGLVFRVALISVNEQREGLPWLQFFNQNDDPTNVAVLLEDGVALFGVCLALLGIGISHWTQSPVPDAVASIVIACLLGLMALTLAYVNSRLLIGASASEADEMAMTDFLEKQSMVEKVIRLKTSVLGPDRLQLSAEIEFHGGVLIDPEQLAKDAEKIRSGEEDPAPVLVDTAERAIRVMGNAINRLEAQLYKEFPDLTSIELEVN